MPKLRSHSDVLRLPLTLPAAARDEPRGWKRVAHVTRAARVVVLWSACGALLAFPPGPTPPAPSVRAALGLLLVAVLVLRVLSWRRARPVAAPPVGWLAVDATGVVRSDASGSARLADWGTMFGVTVLANERRTRALLAFTTAEQTRYVGVRVDEGDRTAAAEAAARELFAQASTAAESDVMLGARGAGDAALGALDAARLLQALRGHASEALGRILLSDTHGGMVVLDGDALRIGERVIDLASPLEWRGFMFFESAGQMSTIVQATWIRQGAIEVVLVAPLPAEVAGVRRTLGGDVEAERAAARDLRLMQAAPDVPPPPELRLAVERIFMVPLRRALDRAPRLVRTPAPRKRPEGHAS